MRRTARSVFVLGLVTAVLAGAVLLGGPASQATPGHGETIREDVGRGLHPSDADVKILTGNETVVYTAKIAPGATSGWHRHPGAIVVLVKGGTMTSYGLDGELCKGQEIQAGASYFEDDAANAANPHFVRNRLDVPLELVIIAFNVPSGGSPRTEADAPAECADPTG